ncbi:BatD family protein [Planctomyces sp. SH-PL62]|uniref:BatD family protein n=1 Tax=Planctomyces sp. SH-PL62 TaxID=1636152 RepID=UPI0018D40C0F|nr:BatD family protein [Planctomyces sp. SH-PL62]
MSPVHAHHGQSSLRPWRRKGLLAGIAVFLMLGSNLRAEDLTVRARARGERILVGQGVDVFVDVGAREQRPKLEPPALKGARMWLVEEAFRPLGLSAIGGSVASDNAFSTRFRLVATAPGRLDVPPIVARLGDRSGRSKALRFTVENPPVAGRPPGFLGGVGDFTASAEVDPGQVRMGGEVTYRIRVQGPGAWGMTTGPDLGRLRGSSIEPRLERLADETSDEPPGRAFVFRVRPMKSGEVVLPPVSIAAFDPRIDRYITRATNGVPLKVVAVPDFDAGGLDYRPPTPDASARRIAVGLALGMLTLAAVGLFALRKRIAAAWRRRFPGGAREARRFAAEAGARLGDDAGSVEDLARRMIEALVEYARKAVGRPPGALTPGEAEAAVARASGSNELGRRAASLAARCDQILFAARGSGGGSVEGDRLKEDARELFEALGRSAGRKR